MQMMQRAADMLAAPDGESAAPPQTLDDMMNEVDQMLGEGEIDPKDVPPSSTPKRGRPAEGKENANHRTGQTAGTDRRKAADDAASKFTSCRRRSSSAATKASSSVLATKVIVPPLARTRFAAATHHA